MHRKHLVLIAGAVLALLLALGTYTQVSAMSAGGLEMRLRASGATVIPGDTVYEPFFAVSGRVLTIDRKSITVFEYPTTVQMRLDAGKISADGTAIGNAQVDWVAPPHFYKGGRVLVLYNGRDIGTQHLLVTILGPQFAGATQAGPGRS